MRRGNRVHVIIGYAGQDCGERKGKEENKVTRCGNIRIESDESDERIYMEVGECKLR